MRTGDQTLIKEINKSITINLVRRKSPISRSQISTESGLNKATVSSLIDELINEGLVVELGAGHSAIGRRPRMLGFNASAGHAIGVELGVDYVRLLDINLAGDVQVVNEEPLPLQSSVQDITMTLVDCIKAMSTQIPASELGIVGVGIGVPGLVDFSQGNVLYAPNLNWTNIPLKSYLEAHISLPIFIDNEANTGALAEQLFGRGQNVSDFVYLSIGTGIGSGIIVNHNLIRGSGGTAGEFGHMVLETHGLRCSCGNRGCLEMYASEKAFIAKYQQLTGNKGTVDEVLSQLHAGDPSALQAIQSVGQYLGIGINNIVNGLNPELVLIGNRLSEAGESLLRPIEQVMQTSKLSLPERRIKLGLASLGRNATAIGAAALVLNDYFQGPIR